jgi:hypothetical protein
MGIVNDASRVPPLRAVVRALANAGVSAGMGLAIVGEKIRFFHRWNLIAAQTCCCDSIASIAVIASQRVARMRAR